MSNSHAKVTRADYDAELLKLPPDLRDGFANNPRRVNELLQRMLVQKSLAAQARAAGTREASRRQGAARPRSRQIPVDDADRGHRRRPRRPSSTPTSQSTRRARASSISSTRRRSRARPGHARRISCSIPRSTAPTQARKLAIETRAKIAAGADMGKLAREMSDDPSAPKNARHARLVHPERDGPGLRGRCVRARQGGRPVRSPCNPSSGGTSSGWTASAWRRQALRRGARADSRRACASGPSNKGVKRR